MQFLIKLLYKISGFTNGFEVNKRQATGGNNNKIDIAKINNNFSPTPDIKPNVNGDKVNQQYLILDNN